MKRFVVTGLLIAGLGAGMALANAQAPRGERGERAPGERPQFDAGQMRQQMLDRMQAQLDATSEEWQVIAPRLENVMTKQREVAAGRMGGMGAWAQRGRQDAPGAQARPGRPGAAEAAGATELQALSAAVESPNTTASELKTRLANLREAREKADAELKQAQEELLAVLTQRQEARLVLMGLLP